MNFRDLEALESIKDEIVHIFETVNIRNMVVTIEDDNGTHFLHWGEDEKSLVGLTEMMKMSLLQLAMYDQQIDKDDTH